MSGNSFQFDKEDLETILKDYRDVKHDINNSIAVIMALAELSQQNPAHYEKLTQTILTRCPDMVQRLTEFQKQISAPLE
jgi:hypothetical protein